MAYDIEYEPCILRLTNAQRTALVQAFLSEIEAAGYYGILYASCDFIRNRLDHKFLSKYDIWVAQYSSKCTCPLPYGMWQYSSRNALGIPGYGTSLDCNRVYKDYEQLMIQAGLQGHTAPTPEDTTPNKLDKQRITIGRISSGDRATIRTLCEGLGLISAGLYRETCADGNQWMLDVGPVSSGDAWYIMRKCAELQLIDAGLYKVKKLFISQPMRGKTDEEILKERKALMADVYMKTHEEIEVIKSFFESAPTDATPLWYLGESLKLLGTADFAVFAPGWQDYRGCRIEHDAATQYGIPIVEV